jgi:cell division protein FtsA
MSGVRMEARVHLVTAAVPSVQNVRKCAERCGLHVAELVLEPLASAEAVLTEDEKEIGVVLVDIGGGTTDVVVYVNGALVHTAVIPIGGMLLTSDIAQGLRTPINEAERIKVRHGCALASLADPEDAIEVPGVGGRAARQIPRMYLASIIEPRMEEIFQLVRRVLEESGYYERVGAGAVITGGASQLEATADLAEQVLELPIRKGVPTGVGGMAEMVRSPAMATAVGLLKYGASRPTVALRPAEDEREKKGPGLVRAGETSSGFWARFMSWLKEVV